MMPDTSWVKVRHRGAISFAGSKTDRKCAAPLLRSSGWCEKLVMGALVSLVGGCAIGASTEMPRPVQGSPPVANVVEIPTVGAELIGFDPGDLVSRASLVRMDDHATCFDVVVREPRALVTKPAFAPGHPDPQVWHLSLDVDGREAKRFDVPLRLCEAGGCLPADSPLEAYAQEDVDVAPLGERFCVEHAPVARQKLALIEHEKVGTATFTFHFQEGADRVSP